MDKDDKNEITQIMSGMRCSKNFECAENNFERLCRARNFILRDYLECLEESESCCQFSVALGYRHFCKCPVRVYLTKKLNK